MPPYPDRRAGVLGALAAALFAGLVAAVPARALTAADCASLTTATVPDTTIASAVLVAAGGGLPEYCEVTGHVDAEIDFELRLPTNWNGKLYHAGGSGFVGWIPGPAAGIRRGYAEVATDTGHVGTGLVAALDGSWALDNLERQVNFGYRAIHVVTVAAKQIVSAAYGQAPRHSYLEGCSNGGRQAAMEAQRYPTDFNGIIAGAPAFDWTGLMTSFNWDEQALRAAPIPPPKLSLIAKAVVAQCDALDGLVDGLVADPRGCHFDPSVLTCAAGDAPTCLTPKQVQAAKKIYAGPTSSAGAQLYPGFPPGAEDGGDGWQLWMSGPAEFLGIEFPAPFQFIFQDQYLRFFVFGPAFDSMTFNFDTGPAALAVSSEVINATNPDLSAFKAAGGKLIMWHGWADHALTALRTIQYYEDVIRAMGPEADADDFFRLFLAPGMHHCGGGPGPSAFDALTALENWVERGVAPDAIVAANLTFDRTRPLCAYPKVAVYNGSGSIDDAANFSCTDAAR